MAGFSTLRAYAAADESGQAWITGFRKAVASAATTTSAWIDYSYFAGSPPANFYATSPLAAAYVDASRGIYVPTVSPMTQHVRALWLMVGAASATSTTAGRQALYLCDYLLYYPFIDTDAVGEQQDFDNTVSLSRYASTGGMVMAVGQSAASAIGSFTFTYTNQSGTGGRVSPAISTFAIAGGGQIVSASGVGASFGPFLPLQAGDSSVRSIESVTFTAAGGGLMALVIVKPLLSHVVAQECRRTTSSNLESFGSCSLLTSVLDQAGAARIHDGAVLGLIAAGYAGSMASSILSGILETTWN